MESNLFYSVKFDKVHVLDISDHMLLDVDDTSGKNMF